MIFANESIFSGAISCFSTVVSTSLEEQGTHIDVAGALKYIAQSKNASLGLNLSPGEVARTEYWLQRDGKYLGRIQIRKNPSGRYPGIASHVYYEIRPSEQGKGHGTAILALGIEKARELKMHKLILACDETNIASRKIIERNNGILEEKVSVPDSVAFTLLYTIKL